MPLGEFEGRYFSEELKFSYNHGYDKEIIHGYTFNKTYDVFKNYIDEFYNIKSNSNDSVMISIAKSLLNNLLDRFGLNIEKDITKIVNDNKLTEILQTKRVKNIKYLEDKILVTHGSDISLDICDSHNVDY
jgi:hypothetical protein